MRTRIAAVSLAVLVTGTAGAAVAYVSTAPTPVADQSVARTVPTPQTRVVTQPRPRLKVRFRHCRAGAHLEHGKCVRHVVHTVVEPAPVPAVTTVSDQAAGSSPAGSQEPRSGGGDRPRGARPKAAEHSDESAQEPAESKEAEAHEPEDVPDPDDD